MLSQYTAFVAVDDSKKTETKSDSKKKEEKKEEELEEEREKFKEKDEEMPESRRSHAKKDIASDKKIASPRAEKEMAPKLSQSMAPMARMSSLSTKRNDPMVTLISKQNANGSWNLGDLEGVKVEEVKEGMKELGVSEDVWMTALCIVLLMNKFKSEKFGWEMVVEKARKWLKKQGASASLEDVALKFVTEKGLLKTESNEIITIREDEEDISLILSPVTKT